MESLALLATPTCHAIAERRRKLGEGGSGVERVDDIFGYDWGAQASLLAKAFGAGLSVSAASRNTRCLRQHVRWALIYKLRD